MTELKATTFGNATGVVFPRALLAKLRVVHGDTLYAVETPMGIELTTHHPEFSNQMELARSIMAEDRDVLKKLAE